MLTARGRIAMLAALMAGSLAVGIHGTPAAPEGPPPATASVPDAIDEHDLTLVSEQRISDRVVDLAFTTPALTPPSLPAPTVTSPTKVRVILPVGYDPSAETRYPVLYLLHGGAGQYTDWSNEGAIELTAPYPLITVLPDAGRSAWYTDWYNNGAGGSPMWETYHVRQLIPWIDGHFKTVGTRAGRAIAGLSSGGFGTMSYASRNPDLFVAAAAFSGALDTNTPPVVAGKVIDALAAQDRGGPGSLFGLRETEEVRWRGHNPWDLAPNLRDMELVVRAGNGMAGGEFGGGGPTDPGGYFLEKACYDQSVSFHNRLDALGIEHRWDDYGPGTHNYHYWRDGLRKTLPIFLAAFAEQRPDPSPFSYRSIEPAFDIYDWHVAMHRSALEFASIENASPAGFTLTGSGDATVTTAPLFKPRKRYVVRVGDDVRSMFADRTGRLTIDVSLGPVNPLQQQFTPTHESPATAVYSAAVSIRRANGRL
jgi:S-formylglutathione hydrolase FrmB